MRSALRSAWLFAVLATAGCGHARPYGPGQGPKADVLLTRTAPALAAIQVSRAKVVLNRTARGDLAFIAQAPRRFRGGVEFAGNELVTLAFHEEGYELRYKLDAFPAGYYTGPLDACAVEALLGIGLDAESLVTVVLGGAPVIAPPFEVREQGWSRRDGWEALVLANDRFVQELRFSWTGGQWHVVGGALWERAGDGKGRRLWELEHVDLERVDGAVLPERTRVTAPGARRSNIATIIYRERNIDPEFAKTAGGDAGGDDDGGWDDGGDDGWEDDEDAGWEDEPADDDGAPANADDGGDGAAPGDAAADGEPATDEDDAWDDTAAEPAPEPEPERAPAPAQPKPPRRAEIPSVFRLDPTGLTERGDLCR